jgi:hypothetical protein
MNAVATSPGAEATDAARGPDVQPAPMRVGVKEAAVLLAARTGLPDVAPVDVRELAERGLVRVIVPGRWPLLELPVDLDSYIATGLVAELRAIGEARRAWWAWSLSRWAAAEALGVTESAFVVLASRHQVRPGRFGRYRRPDIARLHQVLRLAGARAQEELAGGG